MYWDQTNLRGSYENGCENGDYIQFTVDGKKSKKLCGNAFESIAGRRRYGDMEIVSRGPGKPALVEVVYVSSEIPPPWDSLYQGQTFEIEFFSAREWTCDERENRKLAKLPMLE